MTDTDNETGPPTLGHFTTYRATPKLWSLDPEERRKRALAWTEGLAATTEATQLYIVQGIESDADVLVWSSAVVESEEAPLRFFTARAAAENAHRDLFEPRHILWGMTRPSQYSRAAKSAQEIDPFAAERAPYLVMYPFTKTAEWYLLGPETRQGMMNEHIRIGKQFREITQLLLYSFGLQDQEFVVVYETHDLQLFSRLVYDLRDTEARRYTKADTPLHTGVRVSPQEWAKTLG
jgi:chlorite dismutase